jgi:hypothetical protein
VSAREERRDEVVHNLVLADDASSDLLDQRSPRARKLTEQLEVARVVGRFRLRRHDPSAPLITRGS